MASDKVDLVPNEAHQRSPLVRLTGTGRETFAAIRAAEMANNSRVAAALSAADVGTCRRVLLDLTQAFAALNSSAGSRGQEGA
jgi:DNA-binding MarR family transcriptional regulator